MEIYVYTSNLIAITAIHMHLCILISCIDGNTCRKLLQGEDNTKVIRIESNGTWYWSTQLLNNSKASHDQSTDKSDVSEGFEKVLAEGNDASSII